MRISQISRCGSLESNDIFIILEPMEGEDITINLTSTVKYQYGNQIENLIRSTLEKYQIQGVLVEANDHGALDCTIEARVEIALERAGVVIDD